MATAAPSVSPTSDGSDVVDSYYRWVRARILELNSSRKFAGIIQARDWPYKEAPVETYFLAIDTETPSRIASPSSPAYTVKLQWVYTIIGTDIKPGQQAPNRSKYRISNAIKQELIHGNYPQFCERQQWSLDEDNVLSALSYYPKESIWWNQILFRDKVDKNTGILFGEGTVLVTSFAPTILG